MITPCPICGVQEYVDLHNCWSEGGPVVKPVPILFDHDPTQIIGHMYAEHDHLRLKFSDSVQITTDELFCVINAGIVVKKYREGTQFVEEVEIWEVSL